MNQFKPIFLGQVDKNSPLGKNTNVGASDQCKYAMHVYIDLRIFQPVCTTCAEVSIYVCLWMYINVYLHVSALMWEHDFPLVLFTFQSASLLLLSMTPEATTTAAAIDTCLSWFLGFLVSIYLQRQTPARRRYPEMYPRWGQAQRPGRRGEGRVPPHFL